LCQKIHKMIINYFFCLFGHSLIAWPCKPQPKHRNGSRNPFASDDVVVAGPKPLALECAFCQPICCPNPGNGAICCMGKPTIEAEGPKGVQAACCRGCICRGPLTGRNCWTGCSLPRNCCPDTNDVKLSLSAIFECLNKHERLPQTALLKGPSGAATHVCCPSPQLQTQKLHNIYT
jgi:hypothetical protein